MNRRKSITIFLLTLFVTAYISISYNAFAQNDEYDHIWIKRNAERRLSVVDRAVKNYARGVEHFKAERLHEAHVAAKDALKVEPRFAEALWLRAMIYEAEENFEKAAAFKQKSNAINAELMMPVLDEREYLAENLEYLKEIYDPPQLYNKVVFVLLFSFGIAIVFFILVSSNFFITFAMRMRQLVYISFSPKRSRDKPLITEKFPGDEPDVKIPWFAYIIAYALCFIFSFGVVIFFDFDSLKEVIGYGIFGGIIMSILVYHIFFNEMEFEGSQKFGRFR